MRDNKLILNKQTNTKLFVVTEHPDTREGVKLNVLEKEEPIRLIKAFKYLGIEVDDSTKWNYYLEDCKDNLIRALTTKCN